ncbi:MULTISPECIES: hypothetical protein [Halorussus]|uniref:hypothetical protein n=1 Tax=Halorussus TaxID=1070314 RepID=UPI00209E3272|nr:hypothetical protein [Halorussus vallis]USZ76157.1 hypothetical protein NGM07_02250 [Halorussus vallis]
MSLSNSPTVHRVSSFLDDHWAVKWFVVPIWLMATALFVVGLAVSATPGDTLQVVALFCAFSFAVVAVGLGIERAVRAFVE